MKTQLVVIGGGPGGYPAAFHAADHGMNVTIVDLEKNPGGVCLYRGCIPSKALLHAAKLIHEAKEAEKIGLSFGEPKLDLDKLRSWKESVVERLTGGTGQLAKARKVNYVQGRATFVSSNKLSVEKTDGGTEEIEFENAIIATGSRPIAIPNVSIDSPNVVDSTGALELKDIPENLLVIGGGYIGLELGSVYNALGSKVSVVEMMAGLLPGADRDLVAVLAKRIKAEFAEIMLKTKVVSVEEKGKKLAVTIQKEGAEPEVKEYDKVLVSVGRRPNSENLGLENTKVKVNDRGFIEIDPQRRTGDPNIYAIGDVVGGAMLAHKATHEGVVAVEAIQGKKTIFEPHAIPAVVFTDPEIAWAGVTADEAKEKGLNVKAAKFPWAASGRATTLERNDGLTKLIVDVETERILGVAMVGVGAGDMIAEGTLAIEMGATAEDLKLTIHPHPTLSETVMEAAEVFYGSSPHFMSN
ncbi:MAG: dihydrolipoyl dehydrogenase [Verrucomicrobia bacterium]|nr:dihydrolipoyl dehydrogenase [Verrucomicrobiota bacterium]